ncbi:DUF3267 domain-containing protein [Paenibacillus sp. 19GGS1-52]|uniref:DUF3267 domain-containing protein n=1 Tax=Paenibacillus sp. 19GGS1-52 TaxID=2758563 RepID=UPI001EFA2DE8|nr:DUF3267 domain-containing protein [Paenibacillus sp. 19GGS1-52]ULO06169.1 DUF3267 domain-containing protein [Paenibacillus sp. 19GGS1-52]
MILWFRNLPQISLDLSEWKPFIQNTWFRKHYMKFVYLLMSTFFLAPKGFGVSFSHIINSPLILIIFVVFIIHEIFHILVINTKGDISLTFRGIFFWLNTNAILSKQRFWVFMSLPFIVLSVIPAITSLLVSDDIKSLLLFISWINLIISSSDIVNSLLILIKPNKSVFCRGYYRVNSIPAASITEANILSQNS